MLDSDERVVADKGYSDEVCITPDTISTPIEASLLSALRARHETANKRLKQFGLLTAKFRHDSSFHAVCFHPVARITQHIFKYEPLFQVKF